MEANPFGGWNIDHLGWIFSNEGQKAINGSSLANIDQSGPITFPAPFQFILGRTRCR
jgi:hypothetical protein